MNVYITVCFAAVSTYNSPFAISITLFTINFALFPYYNEALYIRNGILYTYNRALYVRNSVLYTYNRALYTRNSVL